MKIIIGIKKKLFLKKGIAICVLVFLSSCSFLPNIAHANSAMVALDAGHGGNDSGAVGNGLVEKELTWKITNYCMQYLDAMGISSVMVRTSSDENPSIYERASRASSAGASSLVSFHINSASSSANGAEVLIGNESSYNYFATENGKKFANDLLPKFAILGISSRGYVQRDYGGGSSESYYPDGSMADYYGIIRYARRFGMTGTIIEHAFLSNSHDAEIMKNEANLQSMAYFDAESIASTLLQGGKWIKNDHGWWYRHPDGSFTTDDWEYINSKWYAFDEEGYMRSGWFERNGNTFYLGGPDDGSMKTKWYFVDNNWYWFEDNGAMSRTRWLLIDGNWFWLNDSGAMAVGWANVNGTWYYFDPSNGVMRSNGWLNVNGTWYWLEESGKMSSNRWIYPNGNWYWLKDSGAMATGWEYINGAWYYFDPSGGAMRSNGWLNVNGTWYWLEESGKRSSNRWLNVNGTWYWLQESGAMLRGWLNRSGNWYYLGSNGAMYAGPGTFNINGNNYYIYADGLVVLTRNSWTDDEGFPSNSKNPSTKIYYYDGNGYLQYARTTNTSAMSDSSMAFETFKTSFANKIRANYPSIYKNHSNYGATTPEEFATKVWEAANSENVRPEFLAAQIADETGWLKFGGAVPASACNFGGIGAVDSSPQSYAVFPNIQTGLLAQAQHIKAYSSTATLNNPCVDPRFNLVTRGIAPYIEDYGWGIWASNPTYNIDLLRIMNTIMAG